MTKGLSDNYRCPDWYPLIKAAKYLGVDPWELAARSQAWTNWALAAMTAEAEADESVQNQRQG